MSNTATESKTNEREFGVLLCNRARVQAALEALTKRAARKGLPLVAWSWGKPVTAKELAPHPEFGWQVEYKINVTRIPLTIVGETPKYAGWSFVATLQHLEGENIVRGVEGQEIPSTYRTRGPVCDHCKSNRRRADTFLLRHEDGRMMQVGSSCIADFLGCDDAGKLAAAASYLAEVRGLAEDAIGGSFDASGDRTLEEYLPFVAWVVRTQGWMSRTVARDRQTTGTADYAWILLTDKKERERAQVELSDEDKQFAVGAEAWAENLSDAEVDAAKGDYLHNLRAVARTGLVTHRTAGIAGSMVVAYQREIGRVRERATRAARPVLDAHVGTVGKRQTFRVTLDFVTGFDTAFGYTTILKFRTAEGACIVWKASNTEIARDDVGRTFDVTGTVKAHDEYKGAKQTIVTRCKVQAIEEEKAAS